MTSKPDAVSFHVIQSNPPYRVQAVGPSTRFLLPHSTSKLPFLTGQELLVFFSLQKK